MVQPLKDLFLLDPDVIYLNHGSFGACPRPVFAQYQAWQRELERNPVNFISTRLPGLMGEARADLGAYLGVTGDDVVYFANPTTAVRMICRCLQLEPGDEVLTTDWEYPAMDGTWDLLAYQTGIRYVHQRVPVPLTDPDAFVNAFWEGVNPRTRIIFISHIAAFSALIFPVAEICRRARAAGIMTFIDGAHAPSQIPL
ncbi:MAG: aminotransferase class V-fold PLP-dependent enzyme, partial [Anaerolineae bacterium]